MSNEQARSLPPVAYALVILLLVNVTPGSAAEISASGGPDGAAGPLIVLTIADANAQPKKSFEGFDTKKMNVFDLDGDGVKEIIAKNDNNNIYVFDARTGLILAELEEHVWPNWPYREIGGVAIGDVNGNGHWDLVTASSAGFLTAWEFDDVNATATHFPFRQLFTRHVAPEDWEPDFYERNPWAKGNYPAFDGTPYLADVDGDGSDEIFIQSDNIAGHYALSGNGTILWARLWDDGNANPWVADLDGDGLLEAIFATDAGRIWTYDARNGDIRWSFNARDHGAMPASISVAPGLIDLTGDGRLEVVFGARQAIEDRNDPEWYLKQHVVLFAVRHDGSLLWSKSFKWGNPHVYMFPAAYDVDGDGRDDAIFVDWNTIGHIPGNWQSTGQPNLFALNATGDILMRTPIASYWGNKDVVIADVNGDGVQDILVNAPDSGRDGVAIYAMDGSRTGWFALDGWDATRAPILTDLFGDGRAHLITPVALARSEPNYRDLDVGYRTGRILVMDLRVPYDAAWDGVILFNHALDHVYGGNASVAKVLRNPRILPVSQDPFLLRITGAEHVSAVHARALDGGLWRALRQDGEQWRGDWPIADAQVMITYDDGVRILRTATFPEARAPAGDPPVPPPQNPGASANPLDGSAQAAAPGGGAGGGNEAGNATPGAGVILVAVALALVGKRKRRTIPG